MKRLCFLLLIFTLILTVQIRAQSVWVDFGTRSEALPSANLLQSGKSGVSFSVQINGMRCREIEYQNQTYQRLMIPDGERTGEEGLPEVPFITKLIAVPDCDDVVLSVIPSGEIQFSGYNVCPAPRYERKEWPDGTHSMEEVFEKSE